MEFITTGESHGKGLTVVMEYVPAGLEVDVDFINHQLWRRQQGYGRGGRMKIESDQIEIMSGVRFGKTTGAPVTFWIANKDYANWENIMDPLAKPSALSDKKGFVRPRPGHADLAGYYKYAADDLRDVLERASARETAARVAAGALAKLLLQQMGITIFSHVVTLGGISIPPDKLPENWLDVYEKAEANDLHCAADDATLTAIREKIDEAAVAGVTLGGQVEVVALNVPAGLGSYVQWNRRLDGELAQALMSIQAVKSVSSGQGQLGSMVSGDKFHDGIQISTEGQITRSSNRAGGLEGGVTNGEPVIFQVVMKPIGTMRTPLESVNLKTKTSEKAHFERSDITAVPACGVVAEAMMALVLAKAFIQKYGGDTVVEMQAHFQASQDLVQQRLSQPV